MPAPLTDQEVDALFAPLADARPPATWLLAVSGGADSSAMMHLAADWARRHPAGGIGLVVATVDHGLRPESGAEARTVGFAAAALGLPHATLAWTGAKPQTGVQSAARAARYGLLQAFAESRQLQPAHLLTAHTADDQAETLLMRLARGSGVDGLSAMRTERVLPGSAIWHFRPLLDVPKARLIATLQARGIAWIEDPGNENAKFERIRIRRLLPLLAEAGIGAGAMALSARRLDRANAALEDLADRAWADCATSDWGASVTMNWGKLNSCPAELQIRLIARAVDVMGGNCPSARLAEIESVVGALRQPMPARTLGGTMLSVANGRISVYREPGRAGLPILQLQPGCSAIWDSRFRIELAPSASTAVTARALTAEEWAALRDRLDIDPSPHYPARAARATPVFWRGAELISVPWLGAYALHPEGHLARAKPLIPPGAGAASGGR
jgi:tRNA(Ile)-lysidine synthase